MWPKLKKLSISLLILLSFISVIFGNDGKRQTEQTPKSARKLVGPGEKPYLPKKSSEPMSIEEMGRQQQKDINNFLDLFSTLLPFILIGGVALLIIKKRLEKGSDKKSSISHGSAHFASKKEIKKLLRDINQQISCGEVLGFTEKQFDDL